jgi:hypothetical protein
MSIIQPTLRFNFAAAPGYIDPRWAFTRNLAAVYRDRLGVIKTAQPNNPRWEWDRVTGLCRGLLFENTNTNKFLQNRDPGNAAWTKTNLTATSNTRASYDGTTVLATLTATGANGGISQVVSITAGERFCVSFYVAANTNNFARIAITDGTNTVTSWFDVLNGATGTNTAGATTCIYYDKNIEDQGNGVYRIFLSVTTATSTSFTVTLGPASADNVATANSDSIYGGDGQFEVVASKASSLITTAGSTVTRPTDFLTIPISTTWWCMTEGAMLWDWVIGGRRSGPQNSLFGGWGCASGFSNTLYIAGDGPPASAMYATIISNSVEAALLGATVNWTIGSRNRIMISWQDNNFSFACNGAVSTDVAGYVPGNTPGFTSAPNRITIGGAPWSASGQTSLNDCIAGWEYFNRRPTASEMQELTRV